MGHLAWLLYAEALLWKLTCDENRYVNRTKWRIYIDIQIRRAVDEIQLPKNAAPE